MPAPYAVWKAWLDLLASPRAWGHAETTVYETLVGFLWGLFIGVGLGVLIGRIRWLEMTLNPFIVAIQVVPKVAFVPLFVVWFGFGITSKVIVSAVLAFFPILTNTVLGVKSIESGHRDVMTSLNASRLAVFWRLELPSSLPYILTGMEVGIVLAIIGAIVGEYLGGNSGLGYPPHLQDERVRDRRALRGDDPHDHPGLRLLLRGRAAAPPSHPLAPIRGLRFRRIAQGRACPARSSR